MTEINYDAALAEIAAIHATKPRKAHPLWRAIGEAGSEWDDERRAHILRLEEAMRKTSICGLGQVALGPVVSVLGQPKGGAAARPQPRQEGAGEQPDR